MTKWPSVVHCCALLRQPEVEDMTDDVSGRPCYCDVDPLLVNKTRCTLSPGVEWLIAIVHVVVWVTEEACYVVVVGTLDVHQQPPRDMEWNCSLLSLLRVDQWWVPCMDQHLVKERRSAVDSLTLTWWLVASECVVLSSVHVLC